MTLRLACSWYLLPTVASLPTIVIPRIFPFGFSPLVSNNHNRSSSLSQFNYSLFLTASHCVLEAGSQQGLPCSGVCDSSNSGIVLSCYRPAVIS